MVYCCIPNCKSRAGAIKNKGLSFHQFPCKFELCMQWLEAIPRKNFIPNSKSGSSVVCGKHFHPSDFMLDLKRKQLKPNVVPSIFPKYLKKVSSKKGRRKKFECPDPSQEKDEINEPIGSKPIKLEPDDSKPGTSKSKQLRSRKRKLVDRYSGSSATSSTETASTETASTEVASEGEPLSPEILATKIKVEVDDGSYDDHSVVDRTHAYVNPSALCESVIDTDKKFLVTDGQIIIPDVNVPSTIPNKSSVDRPSGNAVYGALLPSIPGYTFAPATQTSDLRTNLLPNIKVEVDDE